jgi:hypothetical protein
MSSRAERGRVDPSTLGLIVLLLATSALRFMVWPTRPLWLDEAWTGMIVSQPTLADFARQCLYDINAPLYYGIAGLWSQLSGVSDIALRAPAMLFGLLAPLIALGPARLMSRQARYTWCALGGEPQANRGRRMWPGRVVGSRCRIPEHEFVRSGVAFHHRPNGPALICGVHVVMRR